MLLYDKYKDNPKLKKEFVQECFLKNDTLLLDTLLFNPMFFPLLQEMAVEYAKDQKVIQAIQHLQSLQSTLSYKLFHDYKHLEKMVDAYIVLVKTVINEYSTTQDSLNYLDYKPKDKDGKDLAPDIFAKADLEFAEK